MIQRERTDSIQSNSSSLLSAASRKYNQSKFSKHSKAQETIDTAPFVIDTPSVHSSKEKKKSYHDSDNDEYKTRSKTATKQQQQRQRSSSPRKIPPEEKIIDDE